MKFDVQSKDVIHDFWVPDFRMKIDAVPGHHDALPRHAEELGASATTQIVCAELCGLGHAFMRQTAHVLAPAAVRQVGAEDDAKPAGRRRAVAAAAPARPSTPRRSSPTATPTPARRPAPPATRWPTRAPPARSGPDLDKVLKGKDAAFIKQSILHPDAEIAPGFQPGIMPPNYGDTLSAEQVDALVKYLSEVTNK